MTYVERINSLISNINTNLVDFDKERVHSTPPTQVSSEFLTNKEQGDWAERTLMRGINEHSSDFVAVKYGKNDNIIAGENGFKEFYENYQNELDTIGKRPDLLIFKKNDFQYPINDISSLSIEKLDKIVSKALCGIEVRSSAFLIDKYEDYMNVQQNKLKKEALCLKTEILSNYGVLLKEKDAAVFNIIEMLSVDNLHAISFRCPSWRSTESLENLSCLLKQLKSVISNITKRTFLSITPKVEDLKVVHTWIKKYNIPHYYVQVFFDKAYGVSYEKILKLIGNPDLENKEYFIESDIKNQNKTTIKIHANKEQCILQKVNLPLHCSKMKELGRGRLLFYVEFKDSISIINDEGFANLFGFNLL